MYRHERDQLGQSPVRLNLRGRRPYLKDQKHITLRELDPELVDRAIDTGAALQRMGIRVALGIIDPTIASDRLRSNLAPGEVVLYRKGFRIDTATVNIPYCRETMEEGLTDGKPAQRIENVILSDIVTIER